MFFLRTSNIENCMWKKKCANWYHSSLLAYVNNFKNIRSENRTDVSIAGSLRAGLYDSSAKFMLTRLALTSHVYRARASQIAFQCSALPYLSPSIERKGYY